MSEEPNDHGTLIYGDLWSFFVFWNMYLIRRQAGEKSLKRVRRAVGPLASVKFYSENKVEDTPL